MTHGKSSTSVLDLIIGQQVVKSSYYVLNKKSKGKRVKKTRYVQNYVC